MEIFTTRDIQQITNHHLTINQAQQQIADFQTGFPFINIISAAVAGNGILQINDTKFADFYDLNTKNAVLYSGNLYDAMQRAIYMSDVAFYRMRNTLIKTANAIADESFNNLKGILHV